MMIHHCTALCFLAMAAGAPLLSCTTNETPGEADTEELTLSNCASSISGDALPFFEDLFQCTSIESTETSVILSTTDLPPHRSYYYGEGHPNYEEFNTSRGDEYHTNPNQLAEQDISIEILLNPTARNIVITSELVDGVVETNDSEYPLGAVGVALDSVAIFNPLAAPGDDIEEEKYTFDDYNAHPTPDGFYHYHTVSSGPLEALAFGGWIQTTTPGSAEFEVYGIMCDGTVILGCTEADGTSISESTDAQGGHVHDIVNDAGEVWFEDRYHTHVCESGRRFTPEIQYYDSCTRTGVEP